MLKNQQLVEATATIAQAVVALTRMEVATFPLKGAKGRNRMHEGGSAVYAKPAADMAATYFSSPVPVLAAR